MNLKKALPAGAIVIGLLLAGGATVDMIRMCGTQTATSALLLKDALITAAGVTLGLIGLLKC